LQLALVVKWPERVEESIFVFVSNKVIVVVTHNLKSS